MNYYTVLSNFICTYLKRQIWLEESRKLLQKLCKVYGTNLTLIQCWIDVVLTSWRWFDADSTLILHCALNGKSSSCLVCGRIWSRPVSGPFREQPCIFSMAVRASDWHGVCEDCSRDEKSCCVTVLVPWSGGLGWWYYLLGQNRLAGSMSAYGVSYVSPKVKFLLPS